MLYKKPPYNIENKPSFMSYKRKLQSPFLVMMFIMNFNLFNINKNYVFVEIICITDLVQTHK
jgi:hypothetical protein